MKSPLDATPITRILVHPAATCLTALTLVGALTLSVPPASAQECPAQVVENFNSVNQAVHPDPFPNNLPDTVKPVLTDLPRDCTLRVPTFRTQVQDTADLFYTNNETYRIRQRDSDGESQILTNFLKLATGPTGTGESRYLAGGSYQSAETGPTNFAEAAACSVELLSCNNFSKPCNLLGNGSLDTDTSGWSTNTTLNIVADSLAGTGALALANGWASTIVDMQSEFTRFTISGFTKNIEGTAWAGIGADFLDEDGNEIEEIVYTIPKTPDYKQFSLVKLPPAGTRFARLWIYTSDSRSIQIDELDIHAIGCADGVVKQTLVISSPGDQAHAVNDLITVFTSTNNPEGTALQWSSTGLPPGLTLENGTGNIVGQPTEVGQYLVTINVTDGINQSDTSFKWVIVPEGTIVEPCNALPNGTFEDGTENWFASTDLQLTDDASEGLQALSFENGSMSVTIPAQAGTSYTLTGKYKSVSGSDWSGYGIDYLDADKNEFAEEVRTLTATSSYADTSLSSTIPANSGFLRLWIYTPPGRVITLDDLRLKDSSCDA